MYIGCQQQQQQLPPQQQQQQHPLQPQLLALQPPGSPRVCWDFPKTSLLQGFLEIWMFMMQSVQGDNKRERRGNNSKGEKEDDGNLGRRRPRRLRPSVPSGTGRLCSTGERCPGLGGPRQWSRWFMIENSTMFRLPPVRLEEINVLSSKLLLSYGCCAPLVVGFIYLILWDIILNRVFIIALIDPWTVNIITISLTGSTDQKWILDVCPHIDKILNFFPHFDLCHGHWREVQIFRVITRTFLH